MTASAGAPPAAVARYKSQPAVAAAGAVQADVGTATRAEAHQPPPSESSGRPLGGVVAQQALGQLADLRRCGTRLQARGTAVGPVPALVCGPPRPWPPGTLEAGDGVVISVELRLGDGMTAITVSVIKAASALPPAPSTVVEMVTSRPTTRVVPKRRFAPSSVSATPSGELSAARRSPAMGLMPNSVSSSGSAGMEPAARGAARLGHRPR